MSDEPEFLSVEDVIQIHDEQIAAWGGAAGVRELGLLESAVAVPRACFGEACLHEELGHMAAAMLYTSPRISLFDGNKRTRLAALVFLDLNGIDVLDPP